MATRKFQPSLELLGSWLTYEQATSFKECINDSFVFTFNGAGFCVITSDRGWYHVYIDWSSLSDGERKENRHPMACYYNGFMDGWYAALGRT